MLANDPRFHGAAFRAALLAAGLALILAAPQAVWSKDGDSGGSGADHSGSDDSGSSSHSGKGSGGDASDDDGSDDSGRGGKGKDAQERRHTYDGGWRAQIRNGRYQVFDPAGRVVINRKARISDYKKF